MRRETTKIALGVAYQGKRYKGFQYQPGLETVELHLQSALSRIAGEPVILGVAGRTDTGVHALAQVIHIETSTVREPDVWVKGGNAFLPEDIQILWAKPVPEDFHARFSAKSRSYVYYLSDQTPHLFQSPYVWYVKSVDVDRMNAVAQKLLGERSFRAFQSKWCQSPTPNRNMMHLSVSRHKTYIRVDITANAFLHRMVRKIVAALVAVGQNRMDETQLLAAFEAGDRGAMPGQAPAKALFLSDVSYGDALAVHALNDFIWDGAQ